MSNRLPYVEILYNPNRRRRFKTPSPEPNSSSGESSHHRTTSPRKRQRIESATTVTDLDSESPFPPSSFALDRESVDIPSAHATDGYYPDVVYTPPETEALEAGDTIVPGETNRQEDDPEIPVRTFTEFAIYDQHTKALVSMSDLLEMDESGRTFSASGLAGPWIDKDDDDSETAGSLFSLDSDSDSTSGDEPRDEDMPPLRLRLHNIIDVSVHHITEDKEVDMKIYLETEHAWYILLAPSRVYAPFFATFWTHARITNLCLCHVLENPRSTLPQFLTTLPLLDQEDDGICAAPDVLGRPLSGDDFSDNMKTYLRHVLNTICSKNKLDISRVPLIRELLGPRTYTFVPSIEPRNVAKATSKRHPIPHREPQGVPASKALTDASKTDNPKTFLTPIVNRIAEKLFEGSLEVAESMRDEDLDKKQHHVRHQEHPFDPEKVVWGRKLEGGIYESATIDGVRYSIGDYIMTQPPSEWIQKQDQASQTVNYYGNHYWFCQIRYFFDKCVNGKSSKMFHGVWFTHGSKTILQETSHSQALYLLESCDDNSVASIFQKCNLTILAPNDPEPLDMQDKKANAFHCNLLYTEDTAAFTNIPDHALEGHENPSTSCFSCDIKDTKKAAEDFQYFPDSVIIWNMVYHCHDFIYICPSSSADKLLLIGQIIAIKNAAISVHYLGRFDDFVQVQRIKNPACDLVSNERRLFFTEEYGTIHPSKIDGKCFVHHLTDLDQIKEWIKYDDHYYLKQEGSVDHLMPMDPIAVKHCKPCYAEENQGNYTLEEFLLKNSKLVGMELFSGAGGLGLGMDLSAFVETKYAIEYSASAAKTYKANHPHTTVYCQDSSALLKHAVLCNSKPLLSLDTTSQEVLPPLPSQQDKIDFIFGGPPCQSFSMANHSKKQDDIRSTIPCNMLSYAEYYNPSYFLLENVYGFLLHKFYSTKDTLSGPVESIIDFGMVKLVTRALIALGYQVQFKVLQAAQYGVPQSRRRVIFWAAKRGLTLPAFPIPVYAYPKGCHKVNISGGQQLMPVSRSRDSDNPHQCAPLKPISVDMAIGDLKKFDWKNPHIYLPSLPEVRAIEDMRLTKLHIPAFDAVLSPDTQDFSLLPGFPGGTDYALEPQNSFQAWMRLAMDENDKVTGHYTARFRGQVVEGTVTVPLLPKANHRDLPNDLLPLFAQKKGFKHVLYGRIDPNDFFKCQVTTLSPVLKNQFPLHPTQKRIYSVREAARCQGFPDEYTFESVSTKTSTIISDQLRQIGNAVAVPFALALGKELGKALVSDWIQIRREDSVSL